MQPARDSVCETCFPTVFCRYTWHSLARGFCTLPITAPAWLPTTADRKTAFACPRSRLPTSAHKGVSPLLPPSPSPPLCPPQEKRARCWETERATSGASFYQPSAAPPTNSWKHWPMASSCWEEVPPSSANVNTVPRCRCHLHCLKMNTQLSVAPQTSTGQGLLCVPSPSRSVTCPRPGAASASTSVCSVRVTGLNPPGHTFRHHGLTAQLSALSFFPYWSTPTLS